MISEIIVIQATNFPGVFIMRPNILILNISIIQMITKINVKFLWCILLVIFQIIMNFFLILSIFTVIIFRFHIYSILGVGFSKHCVIIVKSSMTYIKKSSLNYRLLKPDYKKVISLVKFVIILFCLLLLMIILCEPCEAW